MKKVININKSFLLLLTLFVVLNLCAADGEIMPQIIDHGQIEHTDNHQHDQTDDSTLWQKTKILCRKHAMAIGAVVVCCACGVFAWYSGWYDWQNFSTSSELNLTRDEGDVVDVTNTTEDRKNDLVAKVKKVKIFEQNDDSDDEVRDDQLLPEVEQYPNVFTGAPNKYHLHIISFCKKICKYL